MYNVKTSKNLKEIYISNASKNIIDTLENEIDTLRTDIIKNNETIKSLKKEVSGLSYATYIALGFSVGSMFSKH